MKSIFLNTFKLTVLLFVLLVGVYPAIIFGIAQFSPNQGKGIVLEKNGKIVGFENVGQNFTQDQYFWGRPSAVDYNGASSGGSNKGAADSVYLAKVQERITLFLAKNPTIQKQDIPSELVTASGSGLDPHISPQAALVQVDRIAKARKIEPAKIQALIQANTETFWLAPSKINVLKLNLALDTL